MNLRKFEVGDIVCPSIKIVKSDPLYQGKIAKIKQKASINCYVLEWLSINNSNNRIRTYWHQTNLILVKSVDKNLICNKISK